MDVRLGEPRRFRDYRLDSPVVREKIRERYGLLFPLDEVAVSPGDIFDSTLLETVAGTL
ncbi:hypothetical protein FACS1894205_7500 [Alphaproteobacteria bacterium]|nr:hypothetical protein FACS1894205_7500 [Alphaproteobacteria bacterium]